MPRKKTEKVLYQLPNGERFDVEGAIKRHPALSTVDALVERNGPADIQFTITASPWTMARLVQILNSAPVNGNPLNAIVPLRLYSNATECDIEDIEYFLHDNHLDATLENIAVGYLSEAATTDPLELDVRLGAISGKYAVTRIAGRYDSETGHLSYRGKFLSHIDFKIPGEPTDAEPNIATVVSEQAPISIEDLEGYTLGSGKWRVIRALKPIKGAPHGGFILERLEHPATHEEE